MRTLALILTTTAALAATPALGQTRPDDTCMDVVWLETGSYYDAQLGREVARTQPNWAYEFNRGKSVSEACLAIKRRAQDNFYTVNPVRVDDANYNAARANLQNVRTSYEAFQAVQAASEEEVARLEAMYVPLRALYDARDYSTYLEQAPEYLSAHAAWPALNSRRISARDRAIATYDSFRDQFRNDPYPAGYDWARGGDQRLWPIPAE